ncbi:hypothetical protein IWZ03DRAFT_93718 [Phyllosticta citriasiana]|uniref:Uncharacterized protein n=1 Tax=Phyllosticta citriasiana TaxID=595635 RepID=A0ABR1KD00_9PEZI
MLGCSLPLPLLTTHAKATITARYLPTVPLRPTARTCTFRPSSRLAFFCVTEVIGVLVVVGFFFFFLFFFHLIWGLTDDCCPHSVPFKPWSSSTHTTHLIIDARPQPFVPFSCAWVRFAFCRRPLLVTSHPARATVCFPFLSPFGLSSPIVTSMSQLFFGVFFYGRWCSSSSCCCLCRHADRHTDKQTHVDLDASRGGGARSALHTACGRYGPSRESGRGEVRSAACVEALVTCLLAAAAAASRCTTRAACLPAWLPGRLVC